MISHRFGVAAAAALILLTGCLPYSCRREESTELMPSDSLSRELAAGVAVDTLELDWSRSASSDAALVHPRTVRFGDRHTDTLYVSDAETGIVYVFDTSGSFQSAIETTEIPYLAGVRADTLAVFDPSGPAMHLLVDGRPAEMISIQDTGRSSESLVYGAFGRDIYYKRVDENEDSFVARVRRDGTLGQRHRLPGPVWRHAGLLRTWGDSVISLSGFRPVIDIVTEDAEVDTLALRGFDSPMLRRTRAFLVGDIHEPPLITSSAAPSGDYLFVLNMRAGWLQIDAFDRSGLLVRRLTEREPAYRKAFFPQDLDVRRRGDGRYEMAVVLTQPEPELRYYVWQPPADF
ncbi:MAG: hypothetical protein WD021_10720 [Rhodothermales bacterium]